MPEIPLIGKHGNGLIAIVDDSDFELVSQYRWRGHKAARSLTVYARGAVDRKPILMHRLIMQPEAGLHIDHIDGNGLNNSRSNLRCVTQAENNRATWPRIMFDKFVDEL